MKTKTLFTIIILLSAVPLLFAGDKITIADTYGTWVNSDYNEKGQESKIVHNPDGIFEIYIKDTDTEPAWTAKCTVTDSWHDREGNLWIKSTIVFVDGTGYSMYGLSKYSDSRTVWELVESGIDYPDEMSPIAGTYSIRYRQ